MKYCDEYTSRKIAVLSTLATIAVVIIHCNSLEDVRNPSWAFVVGRSIAYLQLWAVPFFFMVSGFFFDRTFAEKPLRGNWFPWLERKFKSLAIPYVLWGGVFGFFTTTPIKMYVNHQHGDALLSGTIFNIHGLWGVIDQIIGITHGNLVGALWYIRLLLIVFLTAPLWIGIRKLSRWLILLVGLGFVFGFSTVSHGGGEAEGEIICGFHIAFGGIGWILLGMAVSAFKLEPRKLPLVAVVSSAVLWGVMSGFVMHNRFVDGTWNPILREWFRIAPIFLILVWWGAYDYVPQCLPMKLPEVFGWRFWVYCMHHPMTSLCGGIVYAVVGHGLVGQCIWQIVTAPIVVIVCLLAACLARRFVPRVFALLCGGRT